MLHPAVTCACMQTLTHYTGDVLMIPALMCCICAITTTKRCHMAFHFKCISSSTTKWRAGANHGITWKSQVLGFIPTYTAQPYAEHRTTHNLDKCQQHCQHEPIQLSLSSHMISVCHTPWKPLSAASPLLQKVTLTTMGRGLVVHSTQ